jgi:hypothetical protein
MTRHRRLTYVQLDRSAREMLLIGRRKEDAQLVKVKPTGLTATRDGRRTSYSWRLSVGLKVRIDFLANFG